EPNRFITGLYAIWPAFVQEEFSTLARFQSQGIGSKGLAEIFQQPLNDAAATRTRGPQRKTTPSGDSSIARRLPSRAGRSHATGCTARAAEQNPHATLCGTMRTTASPPAPSA